MKTIVTGASGFLGTALCRALEQHGHEVTRLNSKNCNLTDATALPRFNPTRYDRIFHLAAWTQAGDFCLHHPGEQWTINQAINTNVLTWWQRDQPQAKLITMGTSCAYDPEVDLIESNYLCGTPIDSLFTYAMTKRMLYVGQLALAKQFHLKHLTAVPSTLYGPGYHTDGRQMHFIFDLIRKIMSGARHGTPVILWGDGHQKREIVFVGDFVRALQHLADHCDNDLVNIGAGEELSIRDFARAICDLTGFEFGRIQFDTTRYVGARSKCLNVSKLRKLVPDLRLTPLEEGLKQTIGWFDENWAAVGASSHR